MESFLHKNKRVASSRRLVQNRPLACNNAVFPVTFRGWLFLSGSDNYWVLGHQSPPVWEPQPCPLGPSRPGSALFLSWGTHGLPGRAGPSPASHGRAPPLQPPRLRRDEAAASKTHKNQSEMSWSAQPHLSVGCCVSIPTAEGNC